MHVRSCCEGLTSLMRRYSALQLRQPGCRPSFLGRHFANSDSGRSILHLQQRFMWGLILKHPPLESHQHLGLRRPATYLLAEEDMAPAQGVAP